MLDDRLWPGAARLLRGLFAAGEFPRAYERAESLLDFDPRNTYRIFRDLWADGVSYAGLERAPEGSPWTLFLQACASWRAGDNHRTLALLSAAGRRGPRYAWLRYYGAEVLLRHLDLYALARTEVEAALADSPWLWEARCLRAEIGLALGDARPLAEAKSAAVPELLRSPFYTWLGALELWSGDLPTALPRLEQAASGGSPSPDAHCWLGAARLLSGNPEGALAALADTLKRYPRDMEALTWRGEALGRLGRRSESLEAYDAALEVSDDWHWARAGRALLLLKGGDAERGLADFAALNRRSDPLERPVGADEARALLEKLFPLARGCRRAESHLNMAWMRAGGIPVPEVPPRQPRLLFWLRSEGLATAPDADIARYGESVEAAARAALADDKV